MACGFTIFDKRTRPPWKCNTSVSAGHTATDLSGSERGGLTRYKDRQFKSYSKRDGLNGFIWSLAEGPDGSIWIATYSRGLCRFHEGKFTSYTVSSGLPSDSIWSIYTARDGTLWIGTNGGGLSHLSHGTFTTTRRATGGEQHRLGGSAETAPATSGSARMLA